MDSKLSHLMAYTWNDIDIIAHFLKETVSASGKPQ